jgi:hypothetical protein
MVLVSPVSVWLREKGRVSAFACSVRPTVWCSLRDSAIFRCLMRWPFLLALCALVLSGCGDSGTSNEPGDGGSGGSLGTGGTGGSAGGFGGSAGSMLCAAVDCNDDNECTNDGCNPFDGLCEHAEVVNGTACDFGGLPGLCADGNCEDAARCAGVDCNDDNECTDDGCNPLDGLCEHAEVANGTACDFGGLPGVCRNGACADAMLCAAVACDDGNECTIDACNPLDGQCDFTPVSSPVPCDFQGGPGVCDAGRCIDAGLCDDALARCDDDNECTVDRCDPADGKCSSTAQDADGTACGAGLGVCGSGACEIVPQTKRFTTSCMDLLYGYTADVPVDLTVSPDSAYASGASNTGFTASFRLDQGLGNLLLALGIGSTEITALRVNVATSGANPAALDLSSAETPPFIVDFSTADAVATRTLVQRITPDGLAPSVDFAVSDWSLGILIENMGVPIYTSLAPSSSGPVFSCGPLLPDDGSVRYPQ